MAAFHKGLPERFQGRLRERAVDCQRTGGVSQSIRPKMHRYISQPSVDHWMLNSFASLFFISDLPSLQFSFLFVREPTGGTVGAGLKIG